MKKNFFTPEDVGNEISRLWKAICCNRAIVDGIADAQNFNAVLGLGGSFSANREADLNGFDMEFSSGGNTLFAINPGIFNTVLTGTDGLNGTTTLTLTGDALGSNVSFDLIATLSGTSVGINGSATTDILTYVAGTHSFDINAGTLQVLSTTYTSGLLKIEDTNGILYVGDWDGNINGTRITVNDSNNLIQFNATGAYRFIGVQSFADNAAALGGGLIAGDIYRTGDLLKIVH